MKISPSKIYKPLFTEKPRYVICMGGRASGRSYSASEYALLHLLADDYFRCAIMRFVLSDIRNSIFQEIRDRVEENELERIIDMKENTLEFKYKRNKINGIGFRKSSGDQKSKLKSLANYNAVIIEEADEVAEEDFQQLDDSLRTTKSDITVILLLNPPDRNHWIIKRWFNLVPSGVEGYYRAELKSTETDTVYIHGTYRDNIKNLNQKTILNFERYKGRNPDHYYNMIQGLVSEGARGRIFKNWKIISDAEFEALPYDSYHGLDFGYSNDPAALIEIKQHNDTIWLRELLYEVGLTNTGTKGNSLSERFEALGLKKGEDAIWADSAEPKSIEELRQDGWDVRPAPKGQDSVRAGIDWLISKEVYYTESSKNIDHECHEYKWALDKNKEPTNKPIDDKNHGMDGTRYGTQGHNSEPFIGVV
jgi:phage terminase large subunit